MLRFCFTERESCRIICSNVISSNRREYAMIITTCDIVPGQQVQVLGLVRGNIVTSKHIGRDLMAGLKNIAGGEIKS